MTLDTTAIEELVRGALDDCEVSVEGADGKYQITVVGSVFEGLSAVKRQQQVYRILNEHIASGAIHAVNMRLLTPEEANREG